MIEKREEKKKELGGGGRIASIFACYTALGVWQICPEDHLYKHGVEGIRLEWRGSHSQR